MKFFKYTFVFFLLTLNLRLYSHNTTNVYNITYIIYPNNQNEIQFHADNYNPNDLGFWEEKASKTDDTYSFWYWLSNVSVLGTGGLCILSYFLFPDWFLLLATIFGLLYILNFFVQITSPTSRCLLNSKLKEDFSKSVKDDCKLVVRSSITTEHEKSVKKEGGSEEKLEVKKEVIKDSDANLVIPVKTPDDIPVDLQDNSLGRHLHKYWINFKIDDPQLKGQVDKFLKEQIGTYQRGPRSCPSGCNGNHQIKRNVSWNVPGIENYMLIADDTSAKPWHVGFLWFSLFTILPFSQFYKLWVNRYCDVKKLSITCTSRQ